MDMYHFDPDYLLFVLAKTSQATGFPLTERAGDTSVVKGRYLKGEGWGIGITLERPQLRLVRLSDGHLLREIPTNSIGNFFFDKEVIPTKVRDLAILAPKLLEKV